MIKGKRRDEEKERKDDGGIEGRGRMEEGITLTEAGIRKKDKVKEAMKERKKI